MREKVDWQGVLATTGWLTLVPEGFRQQVLARSTLREFRRGDAIYRLGDEPGGIWGIVSGGLAVEVAPAERGPYFAHFARPGAWFGEAAIITRMPRRVGLRATRPSLLACLPLHQFEAIAAADPLAWRWLSVLSVMHTDLAISVGDDLMIRDPRCRTVALLLRMAGCRAGETGPDFEVDASQSDLASIVNLSRNAVGTILIELEASGMIETGYRRIRIRDATALRALVTDKRPLRD